MGFKKPGWTRLGGKKQQRTVTMLEKESRTRCNVQSKVKQRIFLQFFYFWILLFISLHTRSEKEIKKIGVNVTSFVSDFISPRCSKRAGLLVLFFCFLMKMKANDVNFMPGWGGVVGVLCIINLLKLTKREWIHQPESWLEEADEGGKKLLMLWPCLFRYIVKNPTDLRKAAY